MIGLLNKIKYPHSPRCGSLCIKERAGGRVAVWAGGSDVAADGRQLRQLSMRLPAAGMPCLLLLACPSSHAAAGT